MDQTDIELKLQSETDEVVRKNDDVFSAVLGITNTTGDFLWTGAAGTAYSDKSEPMKVDTPIFIASITKMYTAAVAMILGEREMLSLDDSISKFLPTSLLEGLHRYKGRDCTDQLRVYHLISQTSGLPDYFTEKPKNEESILDRIVSNGDMEWDVEEVVRIVRSGLPAKFPPEPKERESSGNRAYYSDTNYQLLGAIIETVTEWHLHEVFSELILEPLELSSTYLHGYKDPSTILESPPANIYYKAKPLFLNKAMTSFGPDGGMVSNIKDSLKFLRHLMEGKMFTQPSTLQRMKSWRRIFSPFHYGLGLMKFKLPRIFSPFSATPELIGHSGSTSSFLFHSEIDQLYIGGTLNQIENQGRPVRLMLKIINMVSDALSKE